MTKIRDMKLMVPYRYEPKFPNLHTDGNALTVYEHNLGGFNTVVGKVFEGDTFFLLNSPELIILPSTWDNACPPRYYCCLYVIHATKEVLGYVWYVLDETREQWDNNTLEDRFTEVTDNNDDSHV